MVVQERLSRQQVGHRQDSAFCHIVALRNDIAALPCVNVPVSSRVQF